MVRTVVYFLLAVVVLGTIAVPGLGAFALLAVPLVGLGLVWRVALTVVTGGNATDAVVHTRVNHFLGPGGPDDSFADDAREEREHPAPVPARTASAPSYTRNGAGRSIDVPRPVPAGAVTAAARRSYDGVRVAQR